MLYPLSYEGGGGAGDLCVKTLPGPRGCFGRRLGVGSRGVAGGAVGGSGTRLTIRRVDRGPVRPGPGMGDGVATQHEGDRDAVL